MPASRGQRQAAAQAQQPAILQGLLRCDAPAAVSIQHAPDQGHSAWRHLVPARLQISDGRLRQALPVLCPADLDARVAEGESCISIKMEDLGKWKLSATGWHLM